MTDAPPETHIVSHEEEEAPETILTLECNDASTTVSKVEIREHYTEFGTDKIDAAKVQVWLKSSSSQLVPIDLRDAVDELLALAQSGPKGKANTNTLKVDHEIHRTHFKMRRECGGDSVALDADVESAAWKVGKDGATLEWKVEGTLPDGKLADLAILIKKEDVLLSASQVQGELF